MNSITCAPKGISTFRLNDLRGLPNTSLPRHNRAVRFESRAIRARRNVRYRHGNILTLTPALTLTQSEMDHALAILDDCIGEAAVGK